MKTLWVVGAGHEASYGVDKARSMGLRVIVSGTTTECRGVSWVQADTYDPVQTIRRAKAVLEHKGWTLDGVLSFSADVPVTVAMMAEEFGLPGISVETAQIAADKWQMKRRLDECGILTPRGGVVTSLEKLKQALGLLRLGTAPTDFVLKPVDSRGARGVIRLLPNVDLAWAFDEAVKQSRTRRAIVEEWLPGPQISTETVLFKNGSAVTPGFLDRNYDKLDQFRPYVIEDGATQPTNLMPTQKQAVIDVAERAARALGFFGIAKGDLVLSPKGPAVIEMAARLSGGLMSSVQVPVATGVDLVSIAIKLALGETVTRAECEPRRDAGCAMRFFLPSPGKVTSHQVLRHSANIVTYRVPEVGQCVEPITDHTKRAGYVITEHADRVGAERLADQFIRESHVVTI